MGWGGRQGPALRKVWARFKELEFCLDGQGDLWADFIQEGKGRWYDHV